MSEKMLRNIFIVGTLLFLAVLGLMTVDSLTQVVSARTAQLTDQVVAGKQVWQSKNCNDCHTILGIGGYYAPELTKTFNRRGAAWLRAFMKDPGKVIPGTTMPNQNLSDTQVENLVAFFQWVSLIDTNGWPPQPLNAPKASVPPPAPAEVPAALPTPASSSAPPVAPSGNAPAAPGSAAAAGTPSLSGAALFQSKGCSGCHRINGQGGTDSPDLSRIGSVPYDGLPNTPEFLSKWIENPQAQKPDALMPAIPMSAAERDALVQYLSSLK